MPLARELRDALRNLSLKGGSLAIERGLRLLLVVVAAQIVGQTELGRFVFASTVTAMLAQGTDLGLSSWTTRELARSRDGGEGILRVSLVIRLLAGLPYGLAVAAIAWLSTEGDERRAVALLGVAALANAFVDHCSAIHRGYERIAADARLNTSRAVLATAFGLTAVVASRSVVGLSLGLALASVASCALGLATIVRSHASVVRHGRGFDRSLARVALRGSLPIWFAGLFSFFYFKVDTLFLKYMAGDSELGAYGAAYKFFEGALTLPSVILAVNFPKLARAHGDADAQRRLERRLAALLAGSGLVAGAILFFGAAPLVRLAFGADFARATDSLRVLAVGVPILYLNFGLTHFLIARNLATKFTWFSLLMLVLNVGLDLALIPRHSGPGAAWATILTEIALAACCAGALREASARTPRSVPEATRIDPRAA